MKTIKVYAMGSHQTEDRTSGVDFVRVYQPMKFLNGYKYKDYKFEVDIFDINKVNQDNWIEIADKYDLVFLNYTVLDWGYAHMGAAVHGKNKKIIMEIDDAVWFLEKDNITYNKMQELKGDYLITCMLNDVDGVVCTNSYLRNVIADKTYKRHDQILVAPNQVDLDLYNHQAEAKDNGEIVLMHYGSTTHFDDLLIPEFTEGMDMILKEFPQVKFKAVGSFISELRYRWGQRYENAFGDIDIYKWIKDKFPLFMDEADIMVVPLKDSKYCRCKSDIKFIETASAKKCGVFSATRPYAETIVHGKTGYLAKTKEDWYKYLKELIQSVEKRREIGKNAYKYVYENRQMKDNVAIYAEFILKTLGIKS